MKENGIIMYLAQDYGQHITRVTVLRYNASSIWTNGGRRKRFSEFGSYYLTYEEAKADVLQSLEDRVGKAKRFYEDALQKLERAKKFLQ